LLKYAKQELKLDPVSMDFNSGPIGKSESAKIVQKVFPRAAPKEHIQKVREMIAARSIDIGRWGLSSM